MQQATRWTLLQYISFTNERNASVYRTYCTECRKRKKTENKVQPSHPPHKNTNIQNAENTKKQDITTDCCLSSIGGTSMGVWRVGVKDHAGIIKFLSHWLYDRARPILAQKATWKSRTCHCLSGKTRTDIREVLIFTYLLV